MTKGVTRIVDLNGNAPVERKDGAITAEDQKALVNRHFTVMGERLALQELNFQRALALGRLLNRRGGGDR